MSTTDSAEMKTPGKLCDICGGFVPDGSALYDAEYGIALCYYSGDAECYRRLKAIERDYSRSKRGRRRPWAELREMLGIPKYSRIKHVWR